jgi:hypothetical protein
MFQTLQKPYFRALQKSNFRPQKTLFQTPKNLNQGGIRKKTKT